MLKHLRHITLFVEDQEKALTYYRDILGFRVIVNTLLGTDTRWIEVAPSKENQSVIVLTKADSKTKAALVGKQAADHVMFTLETDDFNTDYALLAERGVQFLGEPMDVPWGKEVVFQDLYGNRFNLVERRPLPRAAPRMR